jgi:hypothetical protein
MSDEWMPQMAIMPVWLCPFAFLTDEWMWQMAIMPGASNSAADALSRHPSPPAQLQAISVATPSWLAEVVAGYAADPESVRLLEQLSINPQGQQPFSLLNGVIRHSGISGRVWVGANPELQQRIISALHDSALGGYVTRIREVGHVSRIGYVSDTDTQWICGGYVSVKYPQKINKTKV